MDKTTKQRAARQIEDLPVQAQSTTEVKGGVVPEAPELGGSLYVSPGTVKGFNPQPDPPKVQLG